MLNKATFREIFLSSWSNVNDFVTHLYRKYAKLDGNNITVVKMEHPRSPKPGPPKFLTRPKFFILFTQPIFLNFP